MVETRAPGTEQISQRVSFFEDALWGGGGVPTGAGLVDGGVDQGPWLQERVGGVVFLSFLTRTKRRKMFFFEGCPVGWGGVPTGAGLVDGGVGRVGLGKAGWVLVDGVREAGQGWGGVQGLRFQGGRW